MQVWRQEWGTGVQGQVSVRGRKLTGREVAGIVSILLSEDTHFTH